MLLLRFFPAFPGSGLGLLLLVWLLPTISVGDSLPRSVERQLLEYLAQNYSPIQQLWQDVVIAEEAVQKAESSMDWVVSGSLTGSATKYLTDSHQFLNSYTAGLSFSRPLSDWGRSELSVAIANLDLQQSRHDFTIESEAIYLKVLKLLYDVIRSQHRVAIREQKYDALMKKRHDVSVRLDAGATSESQLVLAEANLALGESQLSLEKVTLQSGYNTLKLYVSEEILAALPERLPLPTPDSTSLPATLAAATGLMNGLNPRIASAGLALQKADAELALAQKTDDPNLSVSSSLSHSRGFHDSSTHTSYGSASLSLTIPISSGGGTASSIRSAELNRDKQQLGLQTIIDEGTTNLERLWADFFAYGVAVEAHRQSLKARQALLQSAEVSYQAGRISVLDLLDEEDRLLNTELQLIDAQYNHLGKYFDLIHQIGLPLGGSDDR